MIPWKWHRGAEIPPSRQDVLTKALYFKLGNEGMFEMSITIEA